MDKENSTERLNALKDILTFISDYYESLDFTAENFQQLKKELSHAYDDLSNILVELISVTSTVRLDFAKYSIESLTERDCKAFVQDMYDINCKLDSRVQALECLVEKYAKLISLPNAVKATPETIEKSASASSED